MANIAELIIKLTGKDQASATLKGVSSQGTGLGTALKAGGVVAGAALGGIGAAAIQTGLQFDKAYDTIKIDTGATGQALKDLQGDMKAVFRDVPTDMQSAATAISDLNTRTGATGETLRGMAEQVLNMSRLTGTDLQQNITSVTRVMGDWGVKNEGASLAMDKLFKVSQATGPSIDEIGRLMVQYGAPLRQMGFGFDEAAAMMGKMQQEGVNTELVMGSLRIGLIKLSKSGEPIPEAFSRIVGEIKNAGSEAEANTKAVEIFGARAGPDMAAAIREGRFEIEDLVATLGDSEGAIADTAAATDDWKEKWVLLRNKAQLALEPLGKIAPIVGPMAPMISRMGPAFIAMGSAMGGTAGLATTKLIPAMRALRLTLVGPVGIAAAVGIGTVALLKFIDANRDAIDKMPVIGGLVKGNARFHRELNDALAETNDLLERNLITMEEAKQRTIQDYGKAIATLKTEYEETTEAVLNWQKLGLEAHDEVLKGVASFVSDMQREGATYEQILKALERAGIDWKDTIVDDVLKEMRIKHAGETSTIVGYVKMMVGEYQKASVLIGETSEDLATETEQDYSRIGDAIKSVLPAVDQTFEEWTEQLTKMYASQMNFDSNLRTLYDQLARANVENVSEIVRTIEEQGPLAAQAAADMLHEGTMGIESYRLLGEHITVTKGYTGDIVGAIEEERATMVLEIFDFARAMVTGFATKLAEETPRAKAAVAIMTGELKAELTGSPEYKTWHWGIGMAEDLARGLITGLGQQESYGSRFLGQWMAAMSGIAALGGIDAATAWADELRRELHRRGEDDLRPAITQALENLTLVMTGKAKEGGEEAAVSLSAGLSQEWLAHVQERMGLGEEAAEDVLGGLTDEADRLKAGLGSDVASSLRWAMASFSTEAGEWGYAISGYVMGGIYSGFREEFGSYAKGIAEIIYNELKEALGASSPAKAMIPLGAAAAEGYSLGFQRAMTPAYTPPALLVAPVVPAGRPAPQAAEIHNHYHIGEHGMFLGDRREIEALWERLRPYVLREFR